MAPTAAAASAAAAAQGASRVRARAAGALRGLLTAGGGQCAAGLLPVRAGVATRGTLAAPPVQPAPCRSRGSCHNCLRCSSSQTECHMKQRVPLPTG